MNNMDILLQDFVNGKIEQDKLENYKGGYKIGFFYTKDLQQAISNLIAENKELKEKIKEINEEYNAEQKHEMENTIPKSKIKAKIEIRKEEKENCKDSIEEKYLLREIYVLQSLLGKE